jgi:hypothetical protein
MKYVLLFLAMVGAVRGAHLLAEVVGVSDIEACPLDVQEALYEECVINTAVALGFGHDGRRLELRGHRELPLSRLCGGCGYTKPPGDTRNMFCQVWGCWKRRRLTVDDDHTSLSEMEQIEHAAVTCIQNKIEEGLTCMGLPGDITIKVTKSDPIDPITVELFSSNPIDLGTACGYAVLAKTGISTVPNSVITGDIGVSPIDSKSISGFSLTLDSTGQFSTASQLVGKAYAPDYSGTIPAALTKAISAMETAYTNVANRPSTYTLTPGTIGGRTITPGVYTSTAAVSINAHVTFEGGAEDIFVIRTTGDLTQAANTHVLLKGGAQAKNIFWQVAGYAQIGAGASMKGILLVKTKVDFITGSSLVGSVYAQTAVNLQMATITQAAGTCR